MTIIYYRNRSIMNFLTLSILLVTILSIQRTQSISVYQQNGMIFCGTLVCDKGAVNCKVISKTDPNDAYQQITEETCSDENGKVLQKKSYRLPNPSGENVNSESGVGPQYEAVIAEQLRKQQQQFEEINKNIQDNIRKAFENNPIWQQPAFPWAYPRFYV